MKEVIFETTDQKIAVQSVDHLRRQHRYVGFQSQRNFRYMLLQDIETKRGLRPGGFWPDPKSQEGTFYVFDTQRGLLNWMAEGREC